MTEQEVIRVLEMQYKDAKDSYSSHGEHCANAITVAISALEKQIPKKPKIMETPLVGEKFWWYCGHCGASRHTGSKTNYCGYCGGKVDWRNKDE